MKNAELLQWARAWGANAVPFSALHWFDTPALQGVRRHLELAAAFQSVLLLTGSNGVGKSALASQWLWKLDARIFLPVGLTQSSLSGCGLLAALAHKLGQSQSFRREGNLQRIETALGQLDQRKLVVVLDEAQLYSHAALEEIRLLLGLNLPTEPTFALILIGDDYLLDSLRLRHHRALYSRLSAHATLGAWTLEESQRYLFKALEAVGLPTRALDPAAAEQLAKAGGGLPRSLQLLARSAWLQAAASARQSITPEDVQCALQQVPCVPGLESTPYSQSA